MSHSDTSLRTWLQGQRELTELHLEIMTLWYDLDGARAAGQTGVAWWAQQRLLIAAVRLTLRAGGVLVPPASDEPEQAFRALAALGRVNQSLCDEAWRLWLRPPPGEPQLEPETDRTLRFIGQQLGAPWAVTRHGAVAQWATSTRLLRSVAQKLGIAQDSDWYLSASPAAHTSWYDEVLAVLADERSSDQRSSDMAAVEET